MLGRAFPLAIRSLSRNRMRSILTVIGIIIGITAVIVVMSAGNAINDLIIGEVESFGTDYIQIEIKTPQRDQASTENALALAGGSVITTLKEKDAKDILKHPNITTYYAAVLGQDIVNFQSEITKTFLWGVNAAYIDIDSGDIAEGRFFTDDEDESLAKVAVIGPKIKNELFGQTNPIDQSIRIGKERFKVVGVMEERGATFGFDLDDMVLVPLKTLQKKILGIDYVSFIFTQVADTSASESTAEDIRAILRDNHNISNPLDDDFGVTTQEDAMELLGTIVVGMQALLIVLASISLVVGGVGIMNIMYVSVTERTYEIGLRKSVGARSRDILTQFLAESVIITLFGAIIGFILGSILSWLVSLVATSQGFDWAFSISITGVLLAMSMSVIVGVVFGLLPAKKAASLEPITALRK